MNPSPKISDNFILLLIRVTYTHTLYRIVPSQKIATNIILNSVSNRPEAELNKNSNKGISLFSSSVERPQRLSAKHPYCQSQQISAVNI